MNTLTLQAVKDNIIRVIFHPDGVKDDCFTLFDYPGKAPVSSDACTLTAETARLQAIATEKTGAVLFRDQTGAELLSVTEMEFTEVPVFRYTTGGEAPVIDRVITVDGERNFIRNLIAEEDHKALQGRVHFRFSEGEAIHGLGQGEEGIYNYRGHTQYLYQHNMRIPMPVIVSSRKYAVLFDASCLMTFNDTENGTYLYFDALEQVDFYFISGKTMDEVIAGIRFLSGRPAMLPKWAYGYIQSKECYRTASELTEVASRYRALGIPLDCVVQDWNTWEPGKWGQKSLDSARFGDMKEQAERLHNMHVHTMVSVWPNMNTGTENHTEFMEAGCMLHDLATYDAFSEEGRAIYFQQAKEGLFDQGFDAWWCDSTEPFSGPDWGGPIKREPWVRFQIVGEEHKKYLPPEKANIYSLMHAKGMYENQRHATEEKRVLNLTRSGYAGSQKYGAVLWSGDITASWATMKRQIAEGLNIAMSGYPYWTLDIGGFFTVGEHWENRGCGCNTDPSPKWFWKGIYDNGVRDRGYKELYVRWIQFGMFLPMFRSHGTDTPREIWNFGDPGSVFYEAIAKAIRMRYLFMPYIYSEAASVVFHDGTLMRSLLFDFPEDPVAASLSTEYLFGRSLLISPVTEPMFFEAGDRPLLSAHSKSWKTYLPSGADWVDYNTKKRYTGGQAVETDTPLDIFPLFIRSGSIVPMVPGLQYADEMRGSTELHIFTGADAAFDLYEDAGDGYGYEKGEHSVIPLCWDDQKKTLIIGSRKGTYPGMQEERMFEILLDEKFLKKVHYSGLEAVLSFRDVIE